MTESESPAQFARQKLFTYAILLASLAFLFFLRVLGQVWVAFCGVSFLPPMEQWYSGLIPYPILLPIQLVILFVQVRMCADLIRGAGFLVHRRPAAGRALKWFSRVYFLAMLGRYVVTMARDPQQRWLGGAIPIIFHWVLAAYLYVYGRFLSRDERGAP